MWGALGNQLGGQGREAGESMTGADQLFHPHDVIRHGIDTNYQEGEPDVSCAVGTGSNRNQHPLLGQALRAGLH